VNSLLEEKSETRKRRLKIRTYKVIPLTPVAGLLEWVENTTPFGGYLLGDKNQLGAHVRYHPNDKLSKTCREELHRASEAEKSKVYQELCRQFRPVLHKFFLEKFPDPAQWFARKLTYSRSVASNSIIGYIVGLGDRHAHNILIDNSTAELIHIDLGVAFEQGKTLKTPEIVPFRLTRDIVDGMGITGYEGVFRRCCEEVTKVLRVNYAALMTIVEVFIHDPLYKWALSPLQALRLQREETEAENTLENADERVLMEAQLILEKKVHNHNPNTSVNTGNTDAERALLRIQQKLQGYEYGEALSVEGQVNELISEATDPERLCKMFGGWTPWL